MAVQRWTDEMLDRQAQTMEQILEGQRMLVQIYQQEHEARVEADRRFNRFIEEQQQINRQLNQRLTESEQWRAESEQWRAESEQWRAESEQRRAESEQRRAESEQIFNRFIEEQQQINRQLAEAILELRRIVYFRPNNGSQN